MQSITDLRSYRVKDVIAWLAANALDAVTTYISFQLGGIEASPFPVFILTTFGATAFWTLKASLTVALPVATVYLARRYPYAENFAWRFMGFSTAVVALVAGWGFYVIAR